MKRRILLIELIRIEFAAVWLCSIAPEAAAQNGSTIYSPNPNQICNRLNRTLFLRTAPDGKEYGLNELDILYWNRTTNLLTGASHQQALSVLDEFINTHGEKLIQDPLKRALLQRDLWALFDWVGTPFPYYRAQFPKARRALESRLAVAIRRLELTTDEIASLPDNYALAEKDHLPDLPMGLFQTNDDWINVRVKNAELMVPMHVRGFGGRSVFTVWFHDADGRKAGMNYLKRLSAVEPMFIYRTNHNTHRELELNPHLPQFPTNSQWALVRRMCVIDTDGRIQPTHVVESMQMRTYLDIRRFFNDPRLDGIPPQHFNEFRMTRDSQADLVSIVQNGKTFAGNNGFFSMGIDPFEFHSRWLTNNDSTEYQTSVFKSCFECHDGAGIDSVNSFTRRLSLSNPSIDTRVRSNGYESPPQPILLPRWGRRCPQDG